MLTDFDLSKTSKRPVDIHLVKGMFQDQPRLVAQPDLVTNSFVGTEVTFPFVFFFDSNGNEGIYCTRGVKRYRTHKYSRLVDLWNSDFRDALWDYSLQRDE